MKKLTKDFLKKYNISEAQFSGVEKISGSLYLSSLTSIPEGFNPTVGGSLDLRSLTSIPEGFNPTVGGSLYLRSGLKARTKKPIGKIVTPKNKLLFWKHGRFVSADKMLTEVISKRGNIYKVKKLHSQKEFYLVTDGETHAHGETIKKAKEDFEFKIISEKLKNEPIKKDTKLTVKYYRLLTGACDTGVRSWMEQNKIPFDVVDGETILVDKNKNPTSISAGEIIPILKETNAYGYEKIKSLIEF